MTSERFHLAYAGSPPWDIGAPQPAIVAAVEAGTIVAPVVDVGCGTGENALFLAARGFEILGVDAVPAAIAAANAKARDRHLAATFLVHDALRLERLGRRFRTVIDSGLFHTFDDDERHVFARSLAAALEPRGRYVMLCFSELERREGGPRRVTQGEIRALFDVAPFRAMSIEPAQMAARLEGGGRQAWLAVIERLPDRVGETGEVSRG